MCLQDPDVSVRGDDLQLPGEVRREAAELPAHLVHIQRRHQQLLPGLTMDFSALANEVKTVWTSSRDYHHLALLLIFQGSDCVL